MHRCQIDKQVALEVAQRGRANASVLPLQIRLDCCAECFRSPRCALGFDCSGVLAKPDLGVQLAGNSACFGDVDCGDFAERDALGLASDVVLKHPTSCAALADANPEATNIGIEVGDVGPAPG